jgi:hypothetical protein
MQGFPETSKLFKGFLQGKKIEKGWGEVPVGFRTGMSWENWRGTSYDHTLTNYLHNSLGKCRVCKVKMDFPICLWPESNLNINFHGWNYTSLRSVVAITVIQPLTPRMLRLMYLHVISSSKELYFPAEIRLASDRTR